MKHRWKIMASLGGLIIFAAASYLYSNTPRLSVDDPEIFRNRPAIVEENGLTFLEWTHGEAGFAFEPRLKVRNDLAIFFSRQPRVQGT